MSQFSTHNGRVSLHRNVGTWRHVNIVTLNFTSLETPTVRYDLSHNRERYLPRSVVLRASRVASMLPVSVAAKLARTMSVISHLNTAAWNCQITFCIQKRGPPVCKVHHTAVVLFTLFTPADPLFNYLHNVAHKSDHYLTHLFRMRIEMKHQVGLLV
jgi:hypothetical protein